MMSYTSLWFVRQSQKSSVMTGKKKSRKLCMCALQKQVGHRNGCHGCRQTEEVVVRSGLLWCQRLKRLVSSSYNHSTLTTLRTFVKESLQMHFKVVWEGNLNHKETTSLVYLYKYQHKPCNQGNHSVVTTTHLFFLVKEFSCKQVTPSQMLWGLIVSVLWLYKMNWAAVLF